MEPPPDTETASCTIIFQSIHYVLKGEKLLKGHQIRHEVIPVPRAISSDCGMAVEIACRDLDEVRRLLAAGGISVARLYRRVGADHFEALE